MEEINHMGLDKAAIVVVTYKRQELLQVLFDSLIALEKPIWRVVIVDNENSPQTKVMVDAWNELAQAQWGLPSADAEGGTTRMVYFPQEKNGGGSGGFSAGTQRAWDLGAEWFWLMDDDVAVLPDSIQTLEKWTDRFEVIQGRRYNFDDTPFYWQYHFITSLGIPDPTAPEAFDEKGYLEMNTACFEGGLFKRNIVQKIGVPDYRFFIYWDDTIYGYLASKHTTPVVVNDFIMRRTRTINNWDIAGKRKLNSTSDMNRYHIMRNRGYMARYFQLYGDFNRFSFGFGTFLTFMKEVIRILAVDHGHFKSGVSSAWRGWRDSRPILKDPNWKPMPPLGND